MNTTNFLLILLGASLILCFILMLMNTKNNNNTQNIEGFVETADTVDPVLEAIQSKLKSASPEQLKSTVKALQQRLIDYGYAQDMNTFVKKTEMLPNTGKCLVGTAEDRDKYMAKSDIQLPGPRIDLSQYVKKSSIPPEKICPPQQEIDYSAYVKKSTLPPNEKCPPCIAPKVKVSAGLCRECPPAPVCPPPQRCPEIKCPIPEPCPAQKECPLPAPCPVPPKCVKCDEIRYIKVPSVITKTVTLDSRGNVISQKIDSGNANPNANPNSNPNANKITTPSATQVYNQNNSQSTAATNPPSNNSSNTPITTNSSNNNSSNPITTYSSTNNSGNPATTYSSTSNPETTFLSTTSSSNPSTTQKYSLLNNIFGSSNNDIPSTTFPAMSNQQDNITLAQSLDGVYGSKKAFCPPSDLNSEFKSYGIYGK